MQHTQKRVCAREQLGVSVVDIGRMCVFESACSGLVTLTVCAASLSWEICLAAV